MESLCESQEMIWFTLGMAGGYLIVIVAVLGALLFGWLGEKGYRAWRSHRDARS